MTENNIHQVNLFLAKAFSYCSIVLVILILLIPTGIFSFSKTIVLMILFAGIPATLFPRLFLALHFPDKFVKYYMLIMMSVLIGLLGSQNGIGIYITYILVPLVSCMYFSRKFTLGIGIVSYIIMIVALFFNTAGKWEIKYKGWTHAITFRNYCIGFTLEYVVIMVFILTLVSRSQQFLESQLANLKLQKIENEKQRKITDFYVNALTGQKTTVFDAISGDMDKFSTEDYVRMAAGHRFSSTIQEMLRAAESDNIIMNNALASIGEYFNLDRIFYLEPDPENFQQNRLSYSWAKKEKYKIRNFYSTFSKDEYNLIVAEYDKNGYIQLIPNDENSSYTLANIDCGLTRYIASVAIGAQIWIPTLSGGTYNGAMCFERLGSKPFSPVDILLLSDIVTTLSMYVISINSERANKAKSAFLSSMSHEIRTPMNAILGMTSVALKEDMNPTVRQSLNIIKSSSEGLLAIINDILDFSKIESGRIEVVPEDYKTLALINDVKTIAEARNFDKGLLLNFHIPEDLPSVLHGDMVRIKQVCVNLVNNAIKYTDSGSVDVYVSCEPRDDNRATMRYSVVDTGQGIKNEDKDKLFQAFSQVNQAQNHHTEGTGLGLAISKQLVEVMGGSINVESEYRKGSTFFFEIPQTIVDATPAGKLENFIYADTTTQEELEEFTAVGKTVLVVDDNEINRVVAEALLSEFGMEIDLADGGYNAIDMCKDKKYDIIFMDHLMPDLDGLETTSAIRDDKENQNTDTPIVALTADAMPGVKEQMLAAGMNDFLSKPIDMELCIAVLRKYFE